MEDVSRLRLVAIDMICWGIPLSETRSQWAASVWYFVVILPFVPRLPIALSEQALSVGVLEL